MRLLVTRPQADGADTIAALSADGHTIFNEPLLDIRIPRGQTLALDGVQALLITSRNGLRAYLANRGRRDLPVFAVGPSSAEAARLAGFAQVAEAEGDAEALTRLVLARLRPEDGALFHPAGTVSAAGLIERLAPAGFDVRRTILYEARTAKRLSDELRAVLEEDSLDGALFFSPRTARTFATLVIAAGLTDSCTRLTAYCLSDNVAQAVQEEGLTWRALRVAAAPNQPALLALVAEDERATSRT